MLAEVRQQDASPLKEEIKLESSLSEAENLLVTILGRLGTVLTSENEKLEQGVATDHQSFIVSKNQALRELMTLQRSLEATVLSPPMIEELRTIRKLVDRNHHLLKLQVSALNDVTTFLTKAAISEQGDGTYGLNHQ